MKSTFGFSLIETLLGLTVSAALAASFCGAIGKHAHLTRRQVPTKETVLEEPRLNACTIEVFKDFRLTTCQPGNRIQISSR